MLNRGLKKEIINNKKYFMWLAANGLISLAAAFFQCFLIAICINKLFFEKRLVKDIEFELVILIGLFIFKFITLYFIENQIIAISSQIKNSIRLKTIKSTMKNGPRLVRNEGTGALLTSLCEGCEKIEKYYSEYIPAFIHMLITLPVFLAIVLYLDKISFLILVFAIPFLPLFMFLISKEAGRKNERYFYQLKEMGTHFFDVLKGIAEIRLFSNEVKRLEAVERVSENFRKITMSILKISFLSAFVIELSSTISTAMIAVSLGLRLLYGRLDFFSSFLIILLTPEIFAPIKSFGAKFHVAMSSVAAFDNIIPYMKNCDDEDNSNDEIVIKPMESPLSLTLKNISFSYSKDQANVLNSINLNIAPGKITLIRGVSGSGKSTIVNILLGLEKEYEGDIFLNDKLIKKDKLSLLVNSITIVTQRIFIFNASLYENVAISKPDASLQEVEEALINASATFYKDLPQGIHTMLSEDGVSLSVGQAQRIALARGFLRGTPLIILDEPTDALDDENERYILETILKLKAMNKSIMIISHKGSFDTICDVKYSIKKGVLI